MDELLEFCEKGLPISLSKEWEEFDKAKQLLLENQYQPDPDDPNTFIKVRPKAEQEQLSESTPLVQIVFPESEGKPEYLQGNGGARHFLPSSLSPDLAQKLKKRTPQRIQFDTTKLSPHLQISLPTSIPSKPPIEMEQKVAIRVAIDVEVQDEDSESSLRILLHPQLLSIGVRKSDSVKKNKLLGYYPCFTRITLRPLFPDPSIISLPMVRMPASNPNDSGSTPPAQTVRKTTGTKLGAGVNGWGIITLNAERTWQNETEEQRSNSDNCKLEQVQFDDDGNAACFEWRVLRWSDGEKYNAKKPHAGFFSSMPSPPFAGGTSVAMREERFPVAEWLVDPQVKRLGTSLKFEVRVEVDMHIVWCAGSFGVFKSIGSDARSIEWTNSFEVQYV